VASAIEISVIEFPQLGAGSGLRFEELFGFVEFEDS
jgi:hypothetical protein